MAARHLLVCLIVFAACAAACSTDTNALSKRPTAPDSGGGVRGLGSVGPQGSVTPDAVGGALVDAGVDVLRVEVPIGTVDAPARPADGPTSPDLVVPDAAAPTGQDAASFDVGLGLACTSDLQCGAGSCQRDPNGNMRCCSRKCDPGCETCFMGRCEPKPDFTTCGMSYCAAPRNSQGEPCVVHGAWCRSGACQTSSIDCCGMIDTAYACPRPEGGPMHCYQRASIARCVAGSGGTTNNYCDTAKILNACVPASACMSTMPSATRRELVVSAFVLNGAWADLKLLILDSVKITATGRWCKGALCSGADGWADAAATSRLLYSGPGAREGQLLARVGGAYTPIGPSFTGMLGAGDLVFYVNDQDTVDNTGSLDVVVEVLR